MGDHAAWLPGHVRNGLGCGLFLPARPAGNLPANPFKAKENC